MKKVRQNEHAELCGPISACKGGGGRSNAVRIQLALACDTAACPLSGYEFPSRAHTRGCNARVLFFFPPTQAEYYAARQLRFFVI